MALTRLGPNQSLNLASNVTGTLPAANGGTGLTSFAPGKILQVASVDFAGDSSTSSSSYQKAGTNFEVSLTPSATSSKILIMMGGGNAYINNDREMKVQMYRQIGSGSLSAMTANDVDGTSAIIGYVMRAVEYSDQMQMPHSFNYLDSPNTTSAVKYAPYFKSDTSNAIYFNTTDSGNWSINLTIMEIGA